MVKSIVGKKTGVQDLDGVSKAVEECLKRMSTRKDAPYWREILRDLVLNNAIPIDLLKTVPVPASEAPRTRFDQVFEACMALAFPGYRKATLLALLGTGDADRQTKVWRAVFPERFKLVHVLIRADSFQDAFSRACDYACRASLRIFRKIPVDLTVRVMFMSEKALRRHLDLRWANRVQKRKKFQLEGREFTPRQLGGARLAALGDRDDPSWSIAKYSEMKDLEKIRQGRKKVRKSEVESESFKKP